MKAISLWQPWATLIAIGEKRFETRHWRPGLQAGEHLAIHAAKRRMDGDVDPDDIPRFVAALKAGGYDECERTLLGAGLSYLPYGKIIAIVRFDGVERTEDLSRIITEDEAAFGNFAPGRYGWNLELVRAIRPGIEFRGQQGLFAIPDSVIDPVDQVVK